MKNKFLFFTIIYLCLWGYDGQSKILILQNADSLIKVSGIITDKEEGKPISAKIFYEKLPYYDDVGITFAKEGIGEYEIYMLPGIKYNVEIKSKGFKTIQKKIIIEDNGNGLMIQNFSLEPVFVNKKITLENLNFARDRSIISTSSYAILDDFLDWLKARPNAIIQLEGHTDLDTRGNATANLQLSQKRVNAVKRYLVKKGIKKNQIRTKAFGGTQPITKERTPEGKAKNRRVEVQVIQQ